MYETEGKKVGHLITLDVTPNTRRRGIGLALLREFEKKLIGKGAEGCFLEVRTDNHAALALYPKAGYVEINRLGNYYHLGIDGIRMAKTLL